MKKFIVKPIKKFSGIDPMTITVDDEDADLLRLHPWAVRLVNGLPTISFQGAWLMGHHHPTLQRVISGAPEGLDADFISGDRTDFRKENLQCISREERAAGWRNKQSRKAA